MLLTFLSFLFLFVIMYLFFILLIILSVLLITVDIRTCINCIPYDAVSSHMWIISFGKFINIISFLLQSRVSDILVKRYNEYWYDYSYRSWLTRRKPT